MWECDCSDLQNRDHRQPEHHKASFTYPSLQPKHRSLGTLIEDAHLSQLIQAARPSVTTKMRNAATLLALIALFACGAHARVPGAGRKLMDAGDPCGSMQLALSNIVVDTTTRPGVLRTTGTVTVSNSGPHALEFVLPSSLFGGSRVPLGVFSLPLACPASSVGPGGQIECTWVAGLPTSGDTTWDTVAAAVTPVVGGVTTSRCQSAPSPLVS